MSKKPLYCEEPAVIRAKVAATTADSVIIEVAAHNSVGEVCGTATEHSALFLDARHALEQPRLLIRLHPPQAPLWLMLETDRRHRREHFPLVAGQPEQMAQ